MQGGDHPERNPSENLANNAAVAQRVDGDFLEHVGRNCVAVEASELAGARPWSDMVVGVRIGGTVVIARQQQCIVSFVLGALSQFYGKSGRDGHRLPAHDLSRASETVIRGDSGWSGVSALRNSPIVHLLFHVPCARPSVSLPSVSNTSEAGFGANPTRRSFAWKPMTLPFRSFLGVTVAMRVPSLRLDEVMHGKIRRQWRSICSAPLD